MLSFVAKRIFSGIVVLFAVAVIAYALLFAGAGDIGGAAQEVGRGGLPAQDGETG